MTDKHHFGELLRQLRHENAVSLVELAHELNCTLSHLSNVELGRAEPLCSSDIVKAGALLGRYAVEMLEAAKRRRVELPS